MQRNLLTSIFIVFIVVLTAQENKQDYIWLMGYDQSLDPGTQGTMFDFNQVPFEPILRNDPGAEFQENSMICSPEGELLVYTNGCALYNAEHQIMPNGDSLNYNNYWEEWLEGDCDYYLANGNMLLLTEPYSESGVYMIQKPTELFLNTQETFRKLKLWYSYVDLDGDGGLGEVTQKNVEFFEGEMISSYLTAIRHNNGEDWWILQPKKSDNVYHTFKLDSNGVFHEFDQGMGPALHPDAGAAGNSRFSPDGESFALFDSYGGLKLFDFDRNTGKLSNLRTLSWISAEGAFWGGMEFSPDSRFVYIFDSDTLKQVDTWEENLEEAVTYVEAYNGVKDPLTTRFYSAALAPDCRIYICPRANTNSYHVINNPNEKGAACDFVQQGVRLPILSGNGAFPNFPRWRVDEEEKCDPEISSMFGEQVYWRRDLIVYPNPVVDRLTVVLPEHKIGRLYVIDMAGQILMSEEVLPGTLSQQLSLGQFPVGTYSVEFIPEENKERRVWTSQVVVVGDG